MKHLNSPLRAPREGKRARRRKADGRAPCGASPRPARQCRRKRAEMTTLAETRGPSPRFDAFLFAPVGEHREGMKVSVLSALARLGVDPWAEGRDAGPPDGRGRAGPAGGHSGEAWRRAVGDTPNHGSIVARWRRGRDVRVDPHRDWGRTLNRTRRDADPDGMAIGPGITSRRRGDAERATSGEG
jgi:hypothetical protein